MLQRGDSVHVTGEGFLHAGHAGRIAVPCRGEGLRVGEGVVERPPFLLPHVEDGTLLGQGGQAGADSLQALRRGGAMRPQEGELFLVALKLHDLPPEMGRHLRWVLPLPGLTQQIEVVDIQGHESSVLLGMAPAVRLIPGPVDDGWTAADGDFIQIPFNGGADTILGEQRILPAGDHKPLLPFEAKAEACAVLDLIPLVLHDEEEVTDIVGILNGLPQIRLQHGAEGRLAPALPQPLDVTDRLFSLALHDDGQAMFPAQPV